MRKHISVIIFKTFHEKSLSIWEVGIQYWSWKNHVRFNIHPSNIGISNEFCIRKSCKPNDRKVIYGAILQRVNDSFPLTDYDAY